jgi:hypothetical protein
MKFKKCVPQSYDQQKNVRSILSILRHRGETSFQIISHILPI